MSAKALRTTRPAFYRIWRIHTLIQADRCPPVPKLARELEVHPRTIERDIEYLRDVLGAPIAFNPRRRVYVYTDPSFELPAVQLKQGELAALMIAARCLADYVQSPLGPVARQALERLSHMMPGQLLFGPGELEHLN